MKSRKLVKILGASGLALFMGIGTLCGVLIAPANTAAQMQASEEAAATAQEKALMEAQEALWNGTLELDPENDPVIDTTESGIEIKYHNLSLSGTWNYDTFSKNYLASTNSYTYGKTTITSLSGYFYVTLGSYNWIIIGRNSSYSWANKTYTITYAQGTATPSEFVKFKDYSTAANALNSQRETASPAGSAINASNSSQTVDTVSSASRSYTVSLSSYTSPVASSEIPANCVLCLCAGTTGNSYYDNTSPYYSYFPSSDLDTAMTNIYNNIKSAAGNQIQSTSLTTYGYNGSSYTTYTHSEYLFPLATNTVNTSQNYCVETYLNSNAKRDIDACWWLRSGYSSYSYGACYVLADGGLNNDAVYGSYGVRPAFVLKLA